MTLNIFLLRQSVIETLSSLRLSLIALGLAIVLAPFTGCSGKVMNEFCAGGAAGGLAGEASSTGGASSSICSSGTGGSIDNCPQLRSKFSNCVATGLQSDVRTVNMLLVIDKSSSMTEPMPTGSGQTKWETTRSALAAVFTRIDGLNEDVKAEINLGLELFPYDPSSLVSLENQDPVTACQVPTGDAAIVVGIDSFASKLRSVFDAINAQSPGGLTPTAEALREAYNYFTIGEGQCLKGSRWVLLVTNGGANCNTGLTCGSETCTQNLNGSCAGNINCCDGAGYLCQDDDAVLTAITQAANAGVKTLVVGIPDSPAAEASLNTYAIAGKAPDTNNISGEMYFPLTESTGMQDLEDYLGGGGEPYVRTCDIVLNQSPLDPASPHVYINCLEVPAAASDGGANGWTLDYTQTPAHLILQGNACTMSMQPGVKAMDIFYDCPK